jgi:hypothetical protein
VAIGIAAVLVAAVITFLLKWNYGVAYCDRYLYNEAACKRNSIQDALTLGLIVAGVAFGTTALVGGYALYMWRISLLHQMRDRLEWERVQRSLREAEQAVYPFGKQSAGMDDGPSESQAELELSLLWNATHERLNLYHKIATQQAQDSFRRAQAAMIAGFLIVFLSLPFSLVADKTATSIAIATLGAAAGALSAFISQTFLRSQEAAAEHLRAYFLQPLEFSRYLVAERLLNTLDEDKKAQGILFIVQGIANFPNPNASDKPQDKRGDSLH